MRRLKHLAMMMSLSVVGFWLTGCASFAHNRVPDAGKLQPPADASQAVKASYQFTSGAQIFSSRNEHPQNIREKMEKEFVDQLKESGYFATLSTDKGGGIQIEADMLNYGSGVPAMIGGFIGGLSLTTIPCWATDNFKVTVKVVSLEGKKTEYVLDDAMTTVIWLPMIVATPFMYPETVSADVRKNLYRNVILKMQQDGVLPAAGKPQLKSRIEISFVPVV